MTPRPALQFAEVAATSTAEVEVAGTCCVGGHTRVGVVVDIDGGGDPTSHCHRQATTKTTDDSVVVVCDDDGDRVPSPPLDELIKTRFEQCRMNGSILRTDPLEPSVIRRRLPGHLGLVAKYQPGLLSNKRSASLPPRVSLDEPYDGTKFNFNRVPESEVLLRLDSGGHRHPVLANVSPLMYGHSLLIPWPHECIPQRLTPGAVDVAVEMLGRSSGSFRVGFNSTGGFSSVNHLHLHVLYPGEVMAALPQPDDDDGGGGGERVHEGCGFPIENAPVLRTVASSDSSEGCRVDLLDWMVPCFSFAAASASGSQRAVDSMRHGVVKFLSTLRDRGIPHNVLFVPDVGGGGAGDGPRIIVIPRKPQHNFDPEKAGYNAALGEMCGYLVAKSRDHYEGFTEDDVIRRMGESVACEPAVLDSLEAELAAGMMMSGGGGDGCAEAV